MLEFITMMIKPFKRHIRGRAVDSKPNYRITAKYLSKTPQKNDIQSGAK